MQERDLPLAPMGAAALRLHLLRPDALESFLAGVLPVQAALLRAAGYEAKAGELMLLPGPSGVAGAVFGLGADRSPHLFGDLPFRLPEGSVWRLANGAAANDPEGGPELGDVAAADPGADTSAIDGSEQAQGRAVARNAPMSDTNGGPAEAG